MLLPEMINKAAAQFPSDAALARALGIEPSLLCNAKKLKKPLPVSACGKLAEIIGIDRFTVAAASDLITEKNEARRAYLLPFVMGRAATIAALTVIIGITALPPDAQAAQGFAASRSGAIGIMSNNQGEVCAPDQPTPRPLKEFAQSFMRVAMHHGFVNENYFLALPTKPSACSHFRSRRIVSKRILRACLSAFDWA